MSLSWKFRNAIMWLATVGTGTSVLFGIPWTTNWLQNSDDSKSRTDATNSVVKPAAINGGLDSPTEYQLAQASSVNLQRMNPPKALPPPVKPVVVAETPPPVPVLLFQGTLLGTIEDSDPSYCFALLKGTDNRVHLVAQGNKIDNQINSAILDTIRAKEVTIKLGEQRQTLKVVEGP